MSYRWTPAGEMRTPITIQAPSDGQDTKGQPLRQWSDLYPNVSAKVIAKGGSEVFAQNQFQPISLYEIRMRYLPGITPLHGVVILPDTIDTQSHYLDIVNVSDIENRHRELLLTCKERQNWTPADN